MEPLMYLFYPLGWLWAFVTIRDEEKRKKFIREDWDNEYHTFGFSLLLRLFFIIFGFLVLSMILVMLYRVIFKGDR